MKQDPALVDILMPTYNQEKFIAQAIESVIMQECDFNYRLIIGEDYSNDRTLEICEKYEKENQDKILLLKNSTNLGLASNYKLLFTTSSAKYIAILEGDDYWVDKDKLRKQVEILEAKPEIGLVHTNYFSLYESGQFKKGHLGDRKDLLEGSVIGRNQIAKININSITTCFRASLAKDNVDFDYIINNKLLTVDIFLWAEICRRADVKYLDEITSVYRVHSNSITGNRNIEAIERFSSTQLRMVNYLMEKYETPQHIKETFYSQNRLDLIFNYVLANKPLKAKLELRNVNKVLTFKQKIIYISAKYEQLNFLCKFISLFYKYGSFCKQSLNTLSEKFKTSKC